MAEYIGREAAIVDFERCNHENPVWTPQRVKTLLMRIPAADVEPVRHGRWEHDGPSFRGGVDWWHCSECERLVSGVENRYSYCPYCGAKMDGGGEDG